MSRATAREWKPGDVAIGKIDLWSGRLLRTERGWVDQDGEHWADSETAVRELRPLAVLDPEDREQAAALIAGFSDQFTSWSTDGERDAERMQAALRAFIPQPGLDEPTALGAVVVDVEDQCYVRGLPLANSQQPWWVVAPHGDRAARWLSWDEFTAVRELAPGVPA